MPPLVLLVDGCYEAEGFLPEDFEGTIQECLADDPDCNIQILRIIIEGKPKDILDALGKSSEEE
jgi:hypothetical protein